MLPSIAMNDQVDDAKVLLIVAQMKKLLALLLVIGVVVGGYFVWQKMELSKEQDAAAALYEAEALEAQLMEETASAETDSFDLAYPKWSAEKKAEYKSALELVISKHEGSSAWARAKLRLGNALSLEDQVEQALAEYQGVIQEYSSRGEELYKGMAFDSLASLQESQKKYNEALESYEKAISLKDNPLKPLAYMGKARTLQAEAGEDATVLQQVEEIYETVIKDYAKTPYARKARALKALIAKNGESQ